MPNGWTIGWHVGPWCFHEEWQAWKLGGPEVDYECKVAWNLWSWWCLTWGPRCEVRLMQLFMLTFGSFGDVFKVNYTHIYTVYIGSFGDDLVSWVLLHYVTWISIQVDASCEIVGYPAEVSWIFQVGELCFRMTRCFLIFWLSDSVVQLGVSYSWFLIGHKILHHGGGREKMLANHGMFTIISSGPDDPSRVVSFFSPEADWFQPKGGEQLQVF